MPADAKLAPTVRQLAERVAQCAGYGADDSQRISSAVARAFEVVLARPAVKTVGAPVDIRFVRNAAYLEVWLTYPDGDDRAAVDSQLSRDVVDGGMDTEFGRERDTAYCRLRRLLPPSKVDHHCALPPDAK